MRRISWRSTRRISRRLWQEILGDAENVNVLNISAITIYGENIIKKFLKIIWR
jgi:hypothetical protein